ncbi:15-cis-phytoene desaturase, chloroplastic/chromoplastic [Amborella trichopoda]|uniref:Amine oxidase domain-containing protein n=1 Tax=Amborella trichopoda TaxID=13333 RepID=W1PJD8_AMBTC|nr:15-cis-phytoene desaturase, chloroplastic/chromoplastic [Amborella trichopoda]ERN07195.1 hypothetical protein AMTR_s00019p00167210 [Amborella trichopoda]|eukprot:XP_006845520.1 15-cis-phytoene desaturase, chloroplastic/chromoplastic [Amborella trichopoda]
MNFTRPTLYPPAIKTPFPKNPRIFHHPSSLLTAQLASLSRKLHPSSLVTPLKSLSKSPSSRLSLRTKCTIADQQLAQPKETGVVIVGAGLAGLAAALRLNSSQIPFLLFEASDSVGGRVRTDSVDGFLLDRGFQIFITAYPEAQKLLDYESLNLQKFYSGALVYYNGGFHRVSDPLRHFWDSLGTITNPIGSITDKVLIGLSRLKAAASSFEDLLVAPESSTRERLLRDGFSSSIIGRFFVPFLGGIFFDAKLDTTSRLYDFVFKSLALGSNTLPSKGIGAIPDQLASRLPDFCLKLNSKVTKLNSDLSTVELENGEVFRGKFGLILGVEEPEAKRLLETEEAALANAKVKPCRSTVCLYFGADDAPIKEPILILNGSGKGIVNNMFFATNVASSYGPKGKTLVSVSLVGSYESWSDEELQNAVREEMGTWFAGSVVKAWNHLRTYRIGFAQPNQIPPTNLRKDPRVGPGVYACGDYRDSATFDGALVSGRRAAEALIEDNGW